MVKENDKEENLQFIYKREYWFANAGINSSEIDVEEKIKELKGKLKEKLGNLTASDLPEIDWDRDTQNEVINLGKKISLDITWVSMLESFPHFNEDKKLKYNEVGYLEFAVEYFKDEPDKKKQIRPTILHMLPVFVLKFLNEFCSLKENQYLYVDTEDPIFIFAISNKTTPIEVEWSPDAIKKYRQVLSAWTELYSGQWDDYKEELYEERTSKNISYRLSELHYIRKTSGFIYITENDYENYFDYYKETVIKPTAEIRSLIFGMLALNKSLDMLRMSQASHAYIKIEDLDASIRKMEYLMGILDTQLSFYYKELDYNKRRYYKKVLSHLLAEFRVEMIYRRVLRKYEDAEDSLQIRYQKENSEKQDLLDSKMYYLNIIFVVGVIAEIASIFVVFIDALTGGSLMIAGIAGIASIIISIGMLLYATTVYFHNRRIRGTDIRYTVDAVIFDEKENVVLIRRRWDPFKGEYALPGGFIELAETPKEAVIRESREETGLRVKIIKEIGIYDKKGRDPRGRVSTTAFLCSATNIESTIGTKSVSLLPVDVIGTELVPIKNLSEKNVAFDHWDIIQDALKLKGDLN